MTPSEDTALETRPVSSLTPSCVNWLWPGRLALGRVSLLDGDPGIGKSLLTLDLCARLSTGRPWPDGSVCPGPANALVINGEDSASDTIKPRLQALGADLDRVFVLHLKDNPDGLVLFLPSQLGVLEDAIIKTAARLVVIDPVVAFLDPAVQVASDASVRQALMPLAALARKYQCLILLLRHLNKMASHLSLYRGGGSIGFQGACRSSWLLTVEPGKPGCRVLAQVKNNDAPPQVSLGYEVITAEGQPPTITWHGVSLWSADRLLAAARRCAGPRVRACEFLKLFLKDGPRSSQEIWPAAQEQGLKRRTMARAKEELGIQNMKLWSEGRLQNYWLLPGQVLPTGAVADESEENSLEPWLSELRKKYPPSTPLD